MTDDIDQTSLALVFGESSKGASAVERARTSLRQFVRGQTMLADASPNAKGRVLDASEALQMFGFEVLRRAIVDGQAAIVPDRNEPARTLKARREALGLPLDRFARILNLKPGQVAQAETPGKVSSIRTLESLARHLAIDERKLGFDADRSADPALGVRFRRLVTPAEGARGLSATAVVKLAEAAWVIARQEELVSELEPPSPLRERFAPDANYDFPTYEQGYRLAERTRELLELGPDQPIKSLRGLIEHLIKIPLVETELGRAIAGATIANGAHRGIVVNIEGRNENPWVRRMTLAHELGHLLWDPAERLESLMVDHYDEVEGIASKPQDVVEMRANAFAVALLAPPHEVNRIVRSHGDTPWSAVIEVSERFGISVSASHAHVQNLMRIKFSKGSDMPTPSDEWKAAENDVNDFFPLRTTPVARRGRFAWAVLRAEADRHISSDTAASLLNAPLSELHAHREELRQITSA